MTFIKYPHLEKFGNSEVANIEFGLTHVFPKLDGTNASVWVHEGRVRCGSRNRELDTVTLGNRDNAGFAQYIYSDDTISENIRILSNNNPDYVFYGEWLVPHTIKHYRKEAWNKFWIFDVYDTLMQEFLPYDIYQTLLEEYGVNYIPCIKKFKNASWENLMHEAKNCKFMLEDPENQVGEGIVIKNYEWRNSHNNFTHAKIVLEQFKDEFYGKMGANTIENKTAAQTICDIACTEHLIKKEHSKIVVDNNGWTSHLIPRLLHTVFYSVVTEELWDCLKKINYGSVNFQELKQLCILKTKATMPELF